MNITIEKFLKDTGSALAFNSSEGVWEVLEPWTLRGRSEVLARANDIQKLAAEIKKINKPSLVKEALTNLVNFTVWHKKDSNFLMFSEGYLYDKIGKDDARTLLAYLRKLCNVLGFDLDKLQRENLK